MFHVCVPYLKFAKTLQMIAAYLTFSLKIATSHVVLMVMLMVMF